MFSARKMAMLLASVLALIALFGQATACVAEQAGVIPCHEQAGDSSAAAADSSEGNCCHVESIATLEQCLPVAAVIFEEVNYQSRTFGAPDGPIQEIEYPPQLLS